jgi:RimJ/RimL family protein N-acetyltransferase
VYLRALEDEDLDRVYGWHNDPDLYESLHGAFRYVSRLTVQEWLRNKQSYSPDQVNLAICSTDDGRHIGNVYLRDIDWIARHGELAIFIGKPGDRQKGYGSAALQLLVRHAFVDLGLRRVYLFVLAENGPAIRTYERSGFAVEGTLRRHSFKHGQFMDTVIMGMCLDEPA